MSILDKKGYPIIDGEPSFSAGSLGHFTILANTTSSYGRRFWGFNTVTKQEVHPTHIVQIRANVDCFVKFGTSSSELPEVATSNGHFIPHGKAVYFKVPSNVRCAVISADSRTGNIVCHELGKDYPWTYNSFI